MILILMKLDYMILADSRLITFSSLQNILIYATEIPFKRQKTIVGWNDEILNVAFVDTTKGVRACEVD